MCDLDVSALLEPLSWLTVCHIHSVYLVRVIPWLGGVSGRVCPGRSRSSHDLKISEFNLVGFQGDLETEIVGNMFVIPHLEG